LDKVKTEDKEMTTKTHKIEEGLAKKLDMTLGIVKSRNLIYQFKTNYVLKCGFPKTDEERAQLAYTMGRYFGIYYGKYLK
jgi:hypothetical protein